jgi:hypothetical protein
MKKQPAEEQLEFMDSERHAKQKHKLLALDLTMKMTNANVLEPQDMLVSSKKLILTDAM